jgi:subfamily B ATP-binding cassette protein MsbA
MVLFLRRLWVFVRPWRSRLIVGSLFGALYAATNGLFLLCVRFVVDVVFPSDNPTSLSAKLEKTPLLKPLLGPLVERISHWQDSNPQAVAFAVVASLPLIVLLRGVFAYLNIYCLNWAAVRAIAGLRTRLFEHLSSLSLDFFSSARTGELVSRVGADTQTLYAIISNSLGYVVKEPLTIISVLSVMFVLQPLLTLICLLVLPLCAIPVAIYGRKVRKSAKAGQSLLSELSNLMVECFTGNRIIKAYNLENTVVARFRETTQRYVGQAMRVIRANEIPSQITEILGAFGVAGVLIYAIKHPKSATPGDYSVFLASAVMMYQPIKALTRLANQISQAQAASERVFELLEIQNSIVEPVSPKPLKAANASIRFDSIEFSYGDRPILKAINLSVKPGTLVALVGETGSGKTTVTNLLLRFYDPQGGAVRIGDMDIREVTTKDLRNQIAVVTQDTILFNDTFRANIAVGRAGATDGEIEAAARHAHAHEFILEKPQGYDTVIGEKGVTLSGGQKQRLAIARALLKNAPILILDEATSSLDTNVEQQIQAALEDLLQGRTTICIAHRLSTIQKADLIVVMDKGSIVETGTHSELLKAGGLYFRLHQLQFRNGS